MPKCTECNICYSCPCACVRASVCVCVCVCVCGWVEEWKKLKGVWVWWMVVHGRENGQSHHHEFSLWSESSTLRTPGLYPMHCDRSWLQTQNVNKAFVRVFVRGDWALCWARLWTELQRQRRPVELVSSWNLACEQDLRFHRGFKIPPHLSPPSDSVHTPKVVYMWWKVASKPLVQKTDGVTMLI